MKFRDFVGKDKAEEVRKIVNTKIGPSDIEHLRTVLREREDGSKIEYYELGFSLSKKNLKRVFDYIKSWLIRYKVPFKATNPYLTLYRLSNVGSVQELTKNMKYNKFPITYVPTGTLTVISSNKDFPNTYNINSGKKDYLVLDYVPNTFHISDIDLFLKTNNINIIHRYCFVKLFEIDSGILKHEIYEDMMYSIPKIPNIRLGNICFIRR